jgi:hydrogenase maturation protease
MPAQEGAESGTRATIVVVGCGNPNRGDDGVGPQVIGVLGARPIAADPRVRLLDAGTDGMAVMFAARGCRTLIIVDACRSGSEPGAIFEVPGGELELRHEPSFSLHDFRWDHALFAGRRMFGADFPSDVTVLLIEAASVELSLELSPRIADAAGQVAARVESLMLSRLAGVQ